MLREVASASYAHHCYMSYGDPDAGVADQLAGTHFTCFTGTKKHEY